MVTPLSELSVLDKLETKGSQYKPHHVRYLPRAAVSRSPGHDSVSDFSDQVGCEE